MTEIAYARFRDPGSSAETYVAVRPSELPELLAKAGKDGFGIPEACDLDLPPEVVSRLRSQLAAPIKRAVPIVGTVVDGTWATGPLEGQAGPAFAA